MENYNDSIINDLEKIILENDILEKKDIELILKKYSSSLKTIKELKKYQYFIPSYQRGYRWQNTQVEALLDDIKDFSLKEKKDDKEFYCLQPLVLKKDDSVYRLVDGQQRCTTIYLILKVLNINSSFELTYETRSKSAEFLKNIESESKNKDENIDFHYIYETYKTIKEWFDKNNNLIESFKDTFLNHTKVIWYETNEDEHDVFSRINMGKIPLTNSELVKALFLQKENFNSENDNLKNLEQIRIANEWDEIEYQLQKNDFWYFLNTENKPDTCIDKILGWALEIHYQKFLLKDFEKHEYWIFNAYELIKKNKKEKFVNEVWSSIKTIYRIVEEWYYDKTLFHLVGYSVRYNSTIEELLSNYLSDKEVKDKESFKEKILYKIKHKFEDVEFETIGYGDKNIKKILLFHNIQTTIKSVNPKDRFPFDLFENENWDIEHIASRSNECPEKKYQQKFIDDIKNFILDECLKKEMENATNENFESIFHKVQKHFKSSSEEDHSLGNLCLLDSKTNRGYGNAYYPIKRNTIIYKDKTHQFIPVCTRNVFLKYYTTNTNNLFSWDSDDKRAYFADIKNSFNINLKEKKQDKI